MSVQLFRNQLSASAFPVEPARNVIDLLLRETKQIRAGRRPFLVKSFAWFHTIASPPFCLSYCPAASLSVDPTPICTLFLFSFSFPPGIEWQKVNKKDRRAAHLPLPRAYSATHTNTHLLSTQLITVNLPPSPHLRFLFSSGLCSSVSSGSVCLRTCSRRTPFTPMLPVFTVTTEVKSAGKQDFLSTWTSNNKTP